MKALETYHFTEDLKIRTRKYIDIMNRGYYCDATELTKDFNAIMGQKRPVTHCASCLRQMISTLRAALEAYEKEENIAKIAEEGKLVVQTDTLFGDENAASAFTEDAEPDSKSADVASQDDANETPPKKDNKAASKGTPCGPKNDKVKNK